MLKIFKNSYKGNLSDSIAINPDHVIAVYETKDSIDVPVTMIYCGVVTYEVEDSYLEVIARLSEK
jgi:hypothetical protein